ncbi:MAG: TIR domain-containing protein [Corynebacterium humireducens]|uniref:TIR domain-containing protein n=1 Tax=Corynebacterium humireducens TaxID=1223514 RepID=A0A7X6SUY0_9CORY|nr:TIR domain-containing protein [Corynebacterium humireducens]
MTTRTVFYSFHYERDVHRVQQVRNINAIQGAPLFGAQEWEKVRQQSHAAIEKWIDDQMSHKRAVVVLIGQETASRPWVRYEIEKAWKMNKPMVGVYIHGLASLPAGSTDRKGKNPFDVALGVNSIPTFDPTESGLFGTIDSKATYANLSRNLEYYVSQAKRKNGW